jgi:hypothetical protein
VVKNVVRFAARLFAAALLVLSLKGNALAFPCFFCNPPPPPPCWFDCGGGQHTNHVPELDPHALGAAVALFGGSAALLVERYRSRRRGTSSRNVG